LLHCQLLRLGVLLLMSATERPLYCITREAFDETTHKVAFRYTDELKEAAQISCWQVLIFRLTLYIGWKGLAPLKFDIVLPPIVVLSTSASSLYSALTSHPQYTRVFNAITLLRQASHHSIRYASDTGDILPLSVPASALAGTMCMIASSCFGSLKPLSCLNGPWHH
jgi:hypothetical protein